MGAIYIEIPQLGIYSLAAKPDMENPGSMFNGTGVSVNFNDHRGAGVTVAQQREGSQFTSIQTVYLGDSWNVEGSNPPVTIHNKDE